MKILQVTAELFPLLKTGGLADVAGALPAALDEAGHETRPLLPAFPAVAAGFEREAVVGTFVAPWGDTLTVARGALRDVWAPGGPVVGYLVENAGLFDRAGNPYMDGGKQPYTDNHRRFAALGLAATHIAHGLDEAWRPDVVHSHDWHAGLTNAYLQLWQERGERFVPTVFTVHNLAYQGVFAPTVAGELGFPPEFLSVNGFEFYGQLSFMKAGLYYATHVTTVSPTYAREIQTEAQGCGLHGLLAARSGSLSGILNGVDPAVWDASTDPYLAANYTPRRMTGKAECKAALQREVGLSVEPDAPLFAIVSRLTEQKGLPLVLSAIDEIVGGGGQLLVLGTGEPALEAAFTEQATVHAGRVAARILYDEPFAHRVFGGSDVTLVPSRFEPCGLTQMYGLAYGSLPLVRRVGGLADTVVDTDLATLDDRTATGFVFDRLHPDDMNHAVRRALALYRRKPDWNRVRRAGMAKRFDWATAAAGYADVYRAVTER